MTENLLNPYHVWVGNKVSLKRAHHSLMATTVLLLLLVLFYLFLLELTFDGIYES